MLPPLLLLLIYEQPGHGYDLMDRLSRLGIAGTEPGHVYRVLRKLERDRHVVSVWVTSSAGPARRRYELTDAGLAELESWMSQLTELDQVLGSCLTRWAHVSGTHSRQAVRPRAGNRPGGGRKPGRPPPRTGASHRPVTI